MNAKAKMTIPSVRFWIFLVPIFFYSIPPIAAADEGIVVDTHAAVEFARVPADLRFPEGLTANPANGDIYVATFDGGVSNSVLRYDRHGKLVARTNFPGITPILGILFNARDHKVYLASVDDFTVGGSRIRRIAADFDAHTAVETVAPIPSVGAPGTRTVANPDGSQDQIVFGDVARVPNGITFDKHGNLLVSDSFQGAIFRINEAHRCGGSKPACTVDTVAHDSLLATAGFPPFGANGIALNRAEDKLFIANTGDDRILRLDFHTGAIDVFAESINGADGIVFDGKGNLWVAANQADNIVALNQNGRVIAQLGAFLGVRDDGSPRGLLFPASVIVLGDDLFVTNLALPLPGATEPESDVTTYTISRIRIPSSLRD